MKNLTVSEDDTSANDSQDNKPKTNPKLKKKKKKNTKSKLYILYI